MIFGLLRLKQMIENHGRLFYYSLLSKFKLDRVIRYKIKMEIILITGWKIYYK